jgi:G3E family GTPase
MPLPVTLLTGFLGSGKTTLLNSLIRQLPRTAVVMNEFGEIGLDHLLLEKTEGPLSVLSGGCVCCTVQGALAPTLRNLLLAREEGRVPAFERAIIETTGIADPVPIVETLLRDRWIASRYRLNGVVACVDAVLGEQQLDSYDEAQRQASVADLLLVTKTDMVDKTTAARLAERLAALNPLAEILTVLNGQLDAQRIEGLSGFDAAAKRVEVQRWLAQSAYQAVRPAPLGGASHARAPLGGAARAAPPHDARIASRSLTLNEPLTWDGLGLALRVLQDGRGRRLLRFKGIANVREADGPVVVHGMRHVQHPPEVLPEWPDEVRASRFVFIVEDMDEAELRSLADDFAVAASSA